MNIIQKIIVIAALFSSSYASAAAYEYITPEGSNIFITRIRLDVPTDFTGRYMESYGASEEYGQNIPNNVLVGWIGHTSYYESFQYINPAKGINYDISFNNIVFWGSDNFWDFEDGKIVNWSIFAWDYKTGQGVKIDPSIGGSWVIPLVPEPSTYAMLVLGLGLIGFQAKRTSSQKGV